MNWVLTNAPLVETYVVAHLLQVIPAILATLVLSLPLARLAQRVAPLRVFIVSGSSLMYAIPSLPLFIVLPILIGTGVRDVVNVVIALTLYGIALLVRSVADGLDSVPADARNAALALGYPPLRRFFAVDLPLAGPVILAGLRVVAVSTLSLCTVGAVLGIPSLGLLFTDGFQRGILAQVVTGIVMTVVLALLADRLLVLAGRLVMPWTRPTATGERPSARRRPSSGRLGISQAPEVRA